MKIFLKQNWSEQFIYGDKTPGIFIGRKQEIENLKSIIKNNNSSAILISSIRGVGKTSFVHKALSEIQKVSSVFVNIGHTLSNEDIKKQKKLILTSLIRAIHFNKEFENDKELKKIYEKSLGIYKKEEKQVNQSKTKKDIGISSGMKLNAKNLIPLFGVFLAVLGLSFDNFWVRIVTGFLGMGVLFLYFSWKKSWTRSLIKKEIILIDNSTEYLEIKFENWLKKQKEKNKRIVFVIDELDKIDEKKSLETIKEYKNLFTRSFTHFIFISSQKIFELVNEDREKDAEDGGVFPTLFTHIFYLSLPKTDEIKLYLNEIFTTQEKIDKKGKNELMNYLLFCSGNDFFDLKRLIADVVLFDKDGKPFIDTEKIKNSDIHFSKIAKLFEYIEEWFLKKHIQELKKHWKNNSVLQKEIFKFLNNKFNKNYSFIKDIQNSATLINLSDFLVDIGIVEKNSATAESNLEERDFEYLWTNKYKRDVKAPLTEDDKMFQKSFNKLVKLANDLDDLPEAYETNKFQNYTSVSEEKDGQSVSGINLYSIYGDYKDIFNKLKKTTQRISITTEKINEAKKIIDEQINNIFIKYFEIFTNLLDKFILEEVPDLFSEKEINQRPQIFTSCPDFQQIFASTTHRIYGKTDNTRSVMVVKDFSGFDSIREGLKGLIEQKNILVINLKKSEKSKKESMEIEVDYRDKIGRNKKKKVKVENFINFSFNDFRQFSNTLLMIKNHLSE